jgi:hypothetical protein
MAIRTGLRRLAFFTSALSGCGKTISAQENFDGPLVCHNNSRTVPQEAQKFRPARPQRVKARGVPLGYVEGLNDARTPLADFFSLLLFRYENQHPWRTLFGHVGEPSGGTAGGKSREDSSTANLNGAETIEGILHRVEGEDSRNLST